MTRRLLLLAVAVGLLIAVHLSGATKFLSVETLARHREALTDWVEAHRMLAALAYTAVYITVVALSLPGAALLTLVGGFLFGALAGTALTVVAASIGASLVFLFARAVLGERALDRFGAQATRLADAIRRNAASYLLVLRLVPLFPFFLVNLVPAFAGVSFGTFVITTFVGIIPATAVFSLAGEGLGAILDQGGAITPSAVLTPQILAGLLGLAALSLLAIPLKKRFGGARDG